MIGVIAKETERRAAEEFFQLFKTPWEFYLPHRSYEFVVATCEDIPSDVITCAMVVYGSNCAGVDGDVGAVTKSSRDYQWLEWNGVEFPVYGHLAVFKPADRPLVSHKGTGGTVGVESRRSALPTVRLGYDLFHEVSFLLSQGQPAKNAHIPTLEIHVSLLRSCMLSAGVPFVEVPPVPAGFEFMACLTHDVDFTGIREHKFDSTMWGFVYRALVGSLVGSLKRRVPWSKCRKNWQAVFSLPLVCLGLKDDFWLEFDRYMEIEQDLGSTFFFIPFKNHAGTRDSRQAPKRRAAKYDLSKMQRQVCNLIENGCEVGLHGIDAWQDTERAEAERRRICEITGETEVGTRMHWLYFAENSPKVLEEAGFCYDSTFGYNDAVGFRGGTAQVFCMKPARSVLELPLAIQDTALFYPDRMNLSETEAMDRCKSLIWQTAIFGGALTVNWHTRSLSPERLWGEFYCALLKEMRKYRVWFGTAQQVVNWFRARRALRFEQVQFAGDSLHLKMAGLSLNGLPPFVVRVHHPAGSISAGDTTASARPLYSDISWKGEAELHWFNHRAAESYIL
jgi:hypothetical protein